MSVRCPFCIINWRSACLLLGLTVALIGANRSTAIHAFSEPTQKYDAILRTDPAHPRAQEDVAIEISLRYGSGYGRGRTPGEPVAHLQRIHDRTIELFIISENLKHFARVRPEDFGPVATRPMETATFQVRHRFPWSGRYRAVVTFAHRSEIHHKQFDIDVQGETPSPPGSRDLSHQKGFDATKDHLATSHRYRVSLALEPPQPVPGQPVKLLYRIHTDDDAPVGDLQVFEGTEMRVAVIREDLRFFSVVDPQLEEDPASVPLVPRVATKMLHGTGILVETLPDGRMVIEHGPIKDLVSISGRMPFRVADPLASEKVTAGDWVEFWLNNDRDLGLFITRIEPLDSPTAQTAPDAIRPSSDHPLFPGPVVPIGLTFPAPGIYAAYGQFKHNGRFVTTQFFIDVAQPTPGGAKHAPPFHEPQASSHKDLTPQERNGMMIYTASKSRSNQPVLMRVGDGTLFPAKTVSCMNCHGPDGRGSREGGAVASDIRYEILTKPYGTKTPSGRTRSPYTDELLKRAIIEGIDSDGHVLDFAMPRWSMSDQDLEDLIAYLRRLGTLESPGVTDSAIKIGTVLDLSGPLASTGRTALQVMERVFQTSVNEGERIYGRTIQLIAADGRNDPHASLEAAKRLVEEERVFCFIGNLGDVGTREVIPYLEANNIPLIAPLAPSLQPESFAADRLFSIFPSLGYQARVLIDYGMRNGSASFAILYSEDEFGLVGLRAAREQLTYYNQKPAAEAGHVYGKLDAETIAEQFKAAQADVVLLLTGDPSAVALIAAADRLSYSPMYLGHNLQVSDTLLRVPQASERIVLTQSIRFGGDHHPFVRAFVDVLRAFPDAAGSDRVIQIYAFAAAEVMVDGLRRGGRNLTRASLVSGLEGVNLDTGVIGTIAFSRENHQGPVGISLVKPDGLLKRFIPVADIREPFRPGLSQEVGR